MNHIESMAAVLEHIRTAKIKNLILDTDTFNEIDDQFAITYAMLAEDIHDAWAAGRLAEGWQYGPVRDDLRRTHPDLVSYGDLPEGEKEYDRRTAAATIRCILAHGYRIVKAEQE